MIINKEKYTALLDIGADISFINKGRLPKKSLIKTNDALITGVSALKNATIIPENSKTPFYKLKYKIE